jgi:hypothetical protein
MDELERLRIRDEVLQALYWMHAEGLADAPPAAELARFLAVHAGDGYRLSDEGERQGKRAFADEFADMTRQGHGECDEDCWCHESPEEAARCLEERRGHVHG